MSPTEQSTWQITLHEAEDSIPYLGTFFGGTRDEALAFALGLRPIDTPVWIRVEHIPCLIIIQ